MVVLKVNLKPLLGDKYHFYKGGDCFIPLTLSGFQIGFYSEDVDLVVKRSNYELL